MRAWYLDNPSEICTPLILGDLGLQSFQIKWAEKNGSSLMEFVENEQLDRAEHIALNATGARAAKLPSKLAAEHRIKENIPETIFVASGTVFVDVRDSADEWIRVSIKSGELVRVPGALYRRFALSEDKSVVFEVLKPAGSHPTKVSRQSETDEDAVVAPRGRDTRQLITELCAHFYTLGWVSGTGGSISIRHGDRVYMAPSGVQKELMKPEEIFVTDRKGSLVFAPEIAGGRVYPSLSQCAPLFLSAYNLRDSGACIHTHDMSCVLITEIYKNEFRCSHQEMIKGIDGHGFKDMLVVPIIENTCHERDLAESLQKAIKAYPRANAVLVRRHGVYVWGKDWISAKTQAECYHYLFDWAYRMHKMGYDPSQPPATMTPVEKVEVVDSSKKRKLSDTSDVAAVSKKASYKHHFKVKAVLSDIEGTTTPISFVKDILFPFAKNNVQQYLKKNFSTKKVQDDIAVLRKEALQDIEQNVSGAVLIPDSDDSEDVIDACVKSVLWQMSIDRKSTGLKQLQGHIWTDGYFSGVLKGQVYDDVPKHFKSWTASGLRLYIYSSGSREAQRLLFGWSSAGDMRTYLSGYFDTSVGHKRSADSYKDIVKSLGVDCASEILFLTDVYEEAVAAKEAGVQAVLLIRPGNAPLPQGHGFPTVHSFDELDLQVNA